MQQGRKWWAKKEDLIQGDTTLEQNAFTDSFKQTHVYNKPVEGTYDKAATQDFTKPSTYQGKPRMSNSHLRWTEVELKYNNIKGRLFENLPKAKENVLDFNPVYSSFNPLQQFVPPTSSKDTLK